MPLIVLPKSCSAGGDPVLLPHPSFALLFSFFLSYTRHGTRRKIFSNAAELLWRSDRGQRNSPVDSTLSQELPHALARAMHGA